ncbi:MAG: LuxR C-terminal-related transcriptional regulator [Gemmatimonadaceae bacterium]|jgi:DNA-binding CsgD family transcriptional regulator|nr:LuxR C-terminal-related transcriptional regulator [Gemmatimonadaceae bacterium]
MPITVPTATALLDDLRIPYLCTAPGGGPLLASSDAILLLGGHRRRVERELSAHASSLLTAWRRRGTVGPEAPLLVPLAGRPLSVAARVVSDSPTRARVLYVLLPTVAADERGTTDDALLDQRLAERSLSRREREVARELATGDSSPAIAARLSVTVYTVRRHTERIFEKLGVRTRGELVRRVAEWTTAAPRRGRPDRGSRPRSTALPLSVPRAKLSGTPEGEAARPWVRPMSPIRATTIG